MGSWSKSMNNCGGPLLTAKPQEFFTFKLDCTQPPAVLQDYHLNVPTRLRILVCSSTGKCISGAVFLDVTVSLNLGVSACLVTFVQ